MAILKINTVQAEPEVYTKPVYVNQSSNATPQEAIAAIVNTTATTIVKNVPRSLAPEPQDNNGTTLPIVPTKKNDVQVVITKTDESLPTTTNSTTNTSVAVTSVASSIADMSTPKKDNKVYFIAGGLLIASVVTFVILKHK